MDGTSSESATIPPSDSRKGRGIARPLIDASATKLLTAEAKKTIDVPAELERVTEMFLDEVGEPEITPLSTNLQKAADGLKKAITKEYHRLLQAGKVPKYGGERSTWGLYALINLLGQGEDVKQPQAKRFGHHGLVTIDLPDDEIDDFKSLTQLLPRKLERFLAEHRMEWLDDQGNKTKNDERVGDITPKPMFLDLTKRDKYETAQYRSNIKADSLQPVILIANTETEKRKLNALVKDGMAYSPFVLVITLKDRRTSDGRLARMQIFTNHERFDGVGAGVTMDYIVQNCPELSLKPFSLVSTADRQILEEDLREADELENAYADSHEYTVKSMLLSPELSRSLATVYESLSRNLSEHHINLSFENFMLLLTQTACGVNGSSIRGGVLKFDPRLKQQLDHFNVGDALTVMQKLLQSNREWLANNGYLNGDNFGLFRPDQSNVSIIDYFRYVDDRLWKLINNFINRWNISGCIAGQVMSSFIAREIVKTSKESGQRLELKTYGYGSPALVPDKQQAAFTINAEPHLAFDYKPLIIKRKYRAEKRRIKTSASTQAPVA